MKLTWTSGDGFRYHQISPRFPLTVRPSTQLPVVVERCEGLQSVRGV